MSDKIVLENGVRIVYEYIPYVRSVSAGIWVENGSRHEPAELSGISHFVEHMLFKGTKNHTAAEIASILDGIGGQSNAFTTKELTSYYIKALDSHLHTALDLLCEMFLSSQMMDSDIELERGVILEEIGMYEDSPEDLASESLSGAVFDGCAVGRPILGCRETLQSMTGATLLEYIAGHYQAPSIVVSLSGRFAKEDIDYIAGRLSSLPAGSKNPVDRSVYRSAAITRIKPIEQNHLCLGYSGLPFDAQGRYAMQLLNSVFGGGMSSRLFQRVREQQGLCYSIYSFLSPYRDSGLFGIYTATNADTEEGALHSIREETERFLQDGVTDEELSRAREQIKANILMGLESTGARMSNMAKTEILFGRAFDPDETIAKYDAVTKEDVLSLARNIFIEPMLSFSAVGKVKQADYYQSLLHGPLKA